MSTQNEDMIVSEISLNSGKEIVKSDGEFYISTFRCFIKQDGGEKSTLNVRFDKDGDLIRDDGSEEEIKFQIKHKIESNLAQVAYQIWRGAFFLADFAIQNRHLFEQKTILEIGSGSGLTSIAVDKICRTKLVKCSDLPEFQTVLTENISLNNSKCQALPLDLTNIGKETKFNFDICLGADIIYDNDLTDAVIEFISSSVTNLKIGGEVIFLFSVDKRYIFTIDQLETVAPSYEYFIAKLEELKSNVPKYIFFEENEHEVSDVKQSFCYERSDDLCILSLKILKK